MRSVNFPSCSSRQSTLPNSFLMHGSLLQVDKQEGKINLHFNPKIVKVISELLSHQLTVPDQKGQSEVTPDVYLGSCPYPESLAGSEQLSRAPQQQEFHIVLIVLSLCFVLIERPQAAEITHGALSQH